MSQSRPSFSYNPDLPTRKWHQKWINPVISLQNAPPTSHGTPAPTKEDGEVGHAGFRIYAWIPMDEDDDVSEDVLGQEVDWWGKPGAPLRPELRQRSEVASAPDIVKDTEKRGEEDVMEIDPPNEMTMNGVVNGESTEAVRSVISPVAAPVTPKDASPVGITSLLVVSPKPQSPLQQTDTEMPDAPPSPIHPSTLPESSSSLLPSPPTIKQLSPSPLSLPHTEPIDPKSPLKSGISPSPTTMEEILGSSKESPPSDPLAQANEVAAGLAIETSTEQAEYAMDAGNLSGAGGGIAGEGIVGGGSEDLGDIEEEGRDEGVREERMREEEEILSESKKNLDTEIVKDDTQQ